MGVPVAPASHGVPPAPVAGLTPTPEGVYGGLMASVSLFAAAAVANPQTALGTSVAAVAFVTTLLTAPWASVAAAAAMALG